MIENLDYLVLLLPGFFIYITLLKFIGSDDKRDSLEIVSFSLILSICVSIVLNILQKFHLVTISILDWRFGLWILITYMFLSVFLLFFFKKIFPWFERKSQLFDSIKSTSRDILFDVFDDKLKKTHNSPIWLHIVTLDNLSITGNLSMQGLTKDNKEAIYLKNVKITSRNPNINADPLSGMLILLKNVKFIGLIDANYSSKNTKVSQNGRK